MGEKAYGADGAVVPVQKFRDSQKLAPAQMSDEEIMKFQSSLWEVLFFIKYSKDKENLNRILKSNEERFKEVERRAVDVIEVITNTGLKYEDSESKVAVCLAMHVPNRCKPGIRPMVGRI